MGRISSSGLVSGLDTKSIIDQLMSLESAPKTQLQSRLDVTSAQKSAYTDLQNKLTGLQQAGLSLQDPLTFQAASTTSSDPTVLTATAAAGASVGSFQFQVARLVSSQQSVTGGFADPDNAKVGAGTLIITQGGGELSQDVNLSDLRGGAGIRRGAFRITDHNGKTATIDISNAVTLQDVVKKINTALDTHVQAKIDGEGLQLFDTSNALTGELSVEDLGDGHAAADLGIAGTTTDVGILGSDINFVSRQTALSQLNDGRGVRHGSTNTYGNPPGPDFRIAAGDGSTYDVTLTGTEKNLGDVIDNINQATGGKVTAEVAAGANGIQLVDHTGGAGSVGVAALGNPDTAKDLGLEGFSNGGALAGGPIIAGLNTVLLSSLNGGKGLSLGTVSVRDRAGGQAQIDLSGAKTVADVLSALNDPSNNLQIQASLNASSTGIQIADTSGATGDLVIGDVSGTGAADLGIAGTFDSSRAAAGGKDLRRQFITANSALSTYNGGKGVALGKFKITTADGKSNEVDLSSGNYVNLGQVIASLNGRQIGVTAAINSTGDGLLLTDTTTGSGHLKVEDVNSTTAADLNIAGTAAPDANGHGGNTLDGSFTRTLDVTANDTLQTVQQKINALTGGGVTAAVINDGSASAPYRLSLSSKNSGRAGRFVFDAGTTGLAAHDLVAAQDAAVFLGGADAPEPLLVTSSKNQLTNVIKGVTIDLHGVSDKPVTLNVTRSEDGVVDQLKKFTDGFNGLVDQINTLTKWDTTKNQGGILLGDSTAQQVQGDLYSMISGVVRGAGKYRILADVGLKLGDGAKLTFDETKFRSAYAADPDAVKNLFATAEKGLGTVIKKSIDKLIDPVTGVISLENNTLDTRTREFQDRMTLLDSLLAQKRTRLETQFSNMESVLAGLQSQQQALGALGSISTLSPATTSKAGNSTSSGK